MLTLLRKGLVNLASMVTGVLPVANGGTNVSVAGITAFNNITGFTAAGATGLTSSSLVFSSSPVLVTPTLGVATGTSLALGGALNLVTTSTDGLVDQNTTAATVGVPVQISPRNRLSGTAWDTDDLVSRTVSFFTEALPTSSAAPSGLWKLGFIDPVTGTITYPMTVTSGGALNTLVGITISGSTSGFGAGPAGAFYWQSGRSIIRSPANAQINFNNAAENAGVGFDFATDAVGKVRTRAQTGYATWDALAYRISGAGGSGTFLRGDGTSYLASVLTLPNAANAGDLLVASGANTIGAQAPAAFTKTDDTNIGVTLGGSPTAALINAMSITMGWIGTLAGSRGGTGYSSLKAAGIAYSMINGYISGTGTAGADNTAQTVKTIAIPANTLTQVGDRLIISFYLQPDTGTAVVVTLTVNGVTCVSFSTGTGTATMTRDVILEYLDATHANITTTPGATPNMAGFDWTVDQDIDVDQSAIANNHITVFSIIGMVYPKGVVAA